MTTLQTLQSAMIRDPHDQSVWLAIADALEEEGQGARAEVVRLWLAEVAPEFRLLTNPERRRELEQQRVTLPLPEYTNSIGMRLAWIPPGKFLMGSSRELDIQSYEDESPRHEVTITKAFYLGIYEVTQEQWERVMGSNPSRFKGARRPVERVWWGQAMKFCKRLSDLPNEKEKGYTYRVPTEAEWEYACRGGASEFSIYHFGDRITKENANLGNPVGETTEVGKYAPNAFGLYDMHGNVWEWCLDGERKYQDRAETDPRGPTKDAIRLIRGGSWNTASVACASAYRRAIIPKTIIDSTGFRVLCEVKP